MYTNEPVRRQFTREDITSARARQIHDRIGPIVDYLNRLQNRMVTLRFKSDDPLFRLAQEAYTALFKMAAELRQIERKI